MDGRSKLLEHEEELEEEEADARLEIGNNDKQFQCAKMKDDEAATTSTTTATSTISISTINTTNNIVHNYPQPPTTIQEADGGRVKRWTVHPGSNRFCCDGRLICSKKHGAFIITIFLMTTTITIFMIFDAPYLWTVSPAIPIVAAILSLFVFSNFFATAFSDPGIVPRVGNLEIIEVERQNVPIDHSETSIPVMRPKSKEVVINGQRMKMKYCTTCRLYRPPRASHCAVCDNCVLMFDHHCPWVGNCIGQRNYAYFYRFVISLSILIVFMFSASIAHLSLVAKEMPFAEAIRTTPMSMVVAIICFLSTWSVAGLACFHTYLLASEQTTNEDLKGVYRKKNRPMGTTERIKNPFFGGCFISIVKRLCRSTYPSVLNARDYTNSDNIGIIISTRVSTGQQH